MKRSEVEIDTRLATFDRHTVWHDELKAAFAACLRSIALARGDGRITVVLGASGVGKERLAAELRHDLEQRHGRRPTYAEVAGGSSTAPVSMGAVYDLILADLGAVGSHYVIATSHRPPGLPPGATKTQHARLLAIDNLLRLLQVPALIVDEAQYLVMHLSQTRQLTNLRAFTFLANRKCAPIVMLATLDIVDVVRSAPDVHRRIRFVRFERFRTADQMKAFAAALGDYDTYLAGAGLLAPGFTLVSERVRFYKASFGCVGNLHNLVYEALSDALRADHLLGSADFDLAERDLIPDRERFEQDTVRLENELDRLRGARDASPTTPSTDDGASPVSPAGTTKKPKVGSVRVGELKRIRHQVGEGRGMRPRPAVA